MLMRLIYCSARDNSVRLDLQNLLSKAVANNQELGVTGLLWYDGNNFVQALEGHRRAVNEVYSKNIAGDPRHHSLVLISCEDIEQRLFPNWSMGLAQDIGQSSAGAKLLRYLPTEKLDPYAVRASSMLSLLEELREDV